MNTATKLKVRIAPLLKFEPKGGKTVISHELMCRCTSYIRDRADEQGWFRGEFLVDDSRDEAVCFDVSCRLIRSGNRITGVVFIMPMPSPVMRTENRCEPISRSRNWRNI